MMRVIRLVCYFVCIICANAVAQQNQQQGQQQTEPFHYPTFTEQKHTINNLMSRCYLGWCETEYLPWWWRNQVLPACDGIYVQRLVPSMFFMPHDSKQKLVITALQTNRDTAGVISLAGSVQVRQGTFQLTSGQGTLDVNAASFAFRGDITGRQESEVVFHADRISGQMTQAATIPIANLSIDKGAFALPQQRTWFRFDSLTQAASDTFVLQNTAASMCPPSNPLWHFVAETIEVDGDAGFAYADDVTFAIADVPVAYLPYFVFPINDTPSSGFLYPSLGSSDDVDAYLEVPFYWRTAPNMDITVYPQLQSVQNQARLLTEAEYRFLMHNHKGEVYAGVTSNGTSHAVHALNYQGSLFNTALEINYAKAKTPDYFKQHSVLPIDTHGDNHVLWQMASAKHHTKNWYINLLQVGYQELDGTNLSESGYALKPRVRAGYKWRSGNKVWQLDMLINHTRFVTDPNDVLDTQVHQSQVQRTITGATLKGDVQSGWWYAQPQLTLYNRHYTGLETVADSTQAEYSDQITKMRIDAGLRFVRASDNWYSLLSPHVIVSHTQADTEQNTLPLLDSAVKPFSMASLLDDRLFDGWDRFAQYTSASMLLRQQWYNANQNISFTFDVGQQYFTDARDVYASRTSEQELYTNEQLQSPIYLGSQWQLDAHQVFVQGHWQQEKKIFTHLAGFYNYLWQGVGFNTGYITSKNPVTEGFIDRVVQGALEYTLSPHWRLYLYHERNFIATHNTTKDITQQKSDMSLVYINCCMQMAMNLANRHFIASTSGQQNIDDKITFNISLRNSDKGVQTDTNAINQAQQTIWGYNNDSHLPPHNYLIP